MSKHQHGPWKEHRNKRLGMEWMVEIRDSRGEKVCFMAHSNGQDPECDAANARLIAVAPMLLDALKYCAERLQIHMVHTEDLIAHMQAIKAITEAEG